MASGIGIAAIGHQLARTRVGVGDLVRQGYLSADGQAALAACGCESYACAEPPSAELLANSAVTRLMAASPIRPGHVSAFIFCSTVFATTALFPDLVGQRIAAAAGLHAARAFSIQHAYCVSIFVALRIMRAYLARIRRPASGVIVCSDAIGAAAARLRAIGAIGVLSDGAAAILVTNHAPRYRLIDQELFMDPSRFRGQAADGSVAPDPRHFMFLAKLIRTLLRRHGIGERDRVAIYPNNLDRRAWERVCAALALAPSALRFGCNVGHVFGADPFLNLQERPPEPGEYCVLAASGVAGAFGAALLQA